MAYDESLAARIRETLDRQAGVVEKKMFGGVCFLLNGNMLVGVWKENMIARIGLEAYEEALAEPSVVEFDITGRPMRGWVMVEPEGVDEDEDLQEWIGHAVEFVQTMPTK